MFFLFFGAQSLCLMVKDINLIVSRNLIVIYFVVFSSIDLIKNLYQLKIDDKLKILNDIRNYFIELVFVDF